MQEKHMKQELSTTQKKEPRKQEMVNTETTDNNVNTDLPAINPLIEQQAYIVRVKRR